MHKPSSAKKVRGGKREGAGAPVGNTNRPKTPRNKRAFTIRLTGELLARVDARAKLDNLSRARLTELLLEIGLRKI